MFEVVYPQKAEEAWIKRRERKKTLLAYHGSQIDNFYSILKVGLQHNFSSAKVGRYLWFAMAGLTSICRDRSFYTEKEYI